MSAFKITSSLNDKVFGDAVAAYTGSRAFIRTLIPILVPSIIHHRINYSLDCFTFHRINNVPYVTISSKVRKGHQLNRLYASLEQLLDSIDSKFLKKLHVILRRNDTKQILEHFRFSIQYDEHDDNSLPTGSEVIQATADLFQQINEYKDYGTYEPEDVSLLLQLTFNSDTPEEYKVGSSEDITIPCIIDSD